MKFLFLIASLFFATQSFAEETQDLSKMLADSHCIPVGGADGNISGYNCDGPLGEKIKEGKVQNLGTQKGQQMELYSQLKNSDSNVSSQKIKMKMELILDGKLVSNPQIITILNQKASISQKENNSNKEFMIEVLPSLQNPKNKDIFLMKFKVTQKINGQQKLLSDSQIIGQANKEAEISVHTEDPNQEYQTVSIKVLPTLL